MNMTCTFKDLRIMNMTCTFKDFRIMNMTCTFKDFRIMNMTCTFKDLRILPRGQQRRPGRMDSPEQEKLAIISRHLPPSFFMPQDRDSY